MKLRKAAEGLQPHRPGLTEDLGVGPRSCVLLRGPNTPTLAACWFAVLKAGGICVATTTLLRARELVKIAEKARVRARADERCVRARYGVGSGAVREDGAGGPV